MNFVQFYHAIPNKKEKRNIRNKIISETKVQHSTFYSWLFRGKVPLLAQEKISQILDLPVETLFPEEN